MENYILPFLWVHGESEEVYRKMIGVIYDANIRAFCVEARPHPGFVKNQWWEDMKVILDEAGKRGMKVWILDDKHFPTGSAAGALKNAPLNFKRRMLTHKSVSVRGGRTVKINVTKFVTHKEKYGIIGTALFLHDNEMHLPKRRKADELMVCIAYGDSRIIDLSPFITDGKLKWEVPEGNWTIEICGLTYDSGMHRDYINMIDEKSCRIQIDAVYETHYELLKQEFGKTIVGFFSDEPELGNGNYLNHYNYLGTDQTLPYSEELARRLCNSLGEEWKLLLPLLWKNNWDRNETARVRYLYMDAVTRLVEECYSKQMGIWCREHGVEYIGHVIEDNNQHARTSTSLGHYFRGLKWQTMAGIDDIGGQVYPDGEDAKTKNIFGYNNDGEFYHYALGKMGSSLGTLNPNMNGRTMCEIFGNYGWSEGVRLEKYLLDHFMVRGVNHFVPHAFTCSKYPEKDCPPHFYAQGHNPQYRHFCELMKYANRICNLISDGKINEHIAILYHGEAEWAGKSMLMQKPGRILAENQIDFCYLPSDVFEEKEFYKTSGMYEGRITIPDWHGGYVYDAWNNTVSVIEGNPTQGLPVILDSHESMILIKGDISKSECEIVVPKKQKIVELQKHNAKVISLNNFDFSVCHNINYPVFTRKGTISKLQGYELTDRKFSGIIRYETEVDIQDAKDVLLEITDAYEGVEVFVNGISAGVQIIPIYRYDLSKLCHSGTNNLRIEVATTLERERGGKTSHSGITGEVKLYLL